MNGEGDKVRASPLKNNRTVTPGVVACLVQPRGLARPSPRSFSLKHDVSRQLERPRRICASAPSWSCCYTKPPPCPTSKPLLQLTFTPTPSACGENAGRVGSLPSRTIPDEVAS